MRTDLQRVATSFVLVVALLVPAGLATPARGAPAAVPHEFLVQRTPTRADTVEMRLVGAGWSMLRDARPGSPTDVAQSLSAELDAAVVPNVAIPLAEEPRFPEQWALRNTGQTGGTAGSDIDIDRAWAVTSNAATVAIIDSGVDATHPDLDGRTWSNPGETPGNAVDDDRNGFVDDVVGWDFVDGDADPADEDGHGTEVAGVIAAAVNGVGTAGVAPSAELMVLRACTSTCPTSAVIEAIEYAVANGATVINLSLGGIGAGLRPVADAIETAGAADVVVVAAAGNLGFDNDATPFYPASFPGDHVLSVAASDHVDALASFSNRGRRSVDLTAPGVDVLTTGLGEVWAMASGTSLAAPHVAAVAAMVRSIDPGMSAPDVAELLVSTVETTPEMRNSTRSGGRLDAGGALVAAAGPRAALGSGPLLGTAQRAVTLVDRSTDPLNDITERTWRWGEESSSARRVTIEVDEPGVTRVTLEVGDAFGATDAVSVEILAGSDFTDTGDSIFRSDALWLSAMRITRGCSPDRFCPDRAVTRGEAAAFVRRAFSLPAATPSNHGDDDGSVYEEDIDAVVASGIMHGCSADRFCPDEDVTRAQMAAILARALDLPPSGSDPFTDDDGSVFEADINTVFAAGVTFGCSVDSFCPGDPVTRGQMAAFLRRSVTAGDM